jgi:hypothetical protein
MPPIIQPRVHRTEDGQGNVVDEQTVQVDVTNEVNKSAIETNLAQDMAAMQTIIDTANTAVVVTTFPQAQQAARDALQRDKDIARNLRRLDRLALNKLDDAT